MKLPRIFIKNQSIYIKAKIALGSSDLHYLKNVMRLRENSCFKIFNEISGEWIARISNNFATIIEKSTNRNPFSKIKINLCFAVVKSKAMKNIIKKATELNVHCLQPIYTNNTTIKAEDVEKKFYTHIKEAAEQCNRFDLPKIFDPIKLEDAIEKYNNIFICDETLKKNLHPIPTLKEYTIVIGTEGGFSKNELSYLKKYNRISLGETILRCDTAAVAAISCIKLSQIGSSS